MNAERIMAQETFMEYSGYDTKQFFDSIAESDGIICYGAGNRFRDFEEYLGETAAGQKLAYCVDKDPSKQGKFLSFCGRQIQIFPPEKLAECAGKNFILLITNYRYDQVQSYLEERGLLTGSKCYVLTHILGTILDARAMQKEIPRNCRITVEPVIPKIIHYCWFGGNPIPPQNKKWMDSWRKFCPDYEIREWNEENYDVMQNAYMREAYESKKWGFVPDYARLDIIYKYGGIYLDTDVELIKGLDELLYQPGFAGFESEKNVALGLGFGAVAGLREIKEMRDMYNSLHFIKEDGGLNLTPSPHYQTAFLKKMGLKENGEYQRVGDFTIYPEKCSRQKVRIADA